MCYLVSQDENPFDFHFLDVNIIYLSVTLIGMLKRVDNWNIFKSLSICHKLFKSFIINSLFCLLLHWLCLTITYTRELFFVLSHLLVRGCTHTGSGILIMSWVYRNSEFSLFLKILMHSFWAITILMCPCLSLPRFVAILIVIFASSRLSCVM